LSLKYVYCSGIRIFFQNIIIIFLENKKKKTAFLTLPCNQLPSLSESRPTITKTLKPTVSQSQNLLSNHRR